jgi:pimeloyl-ACP methyl ester carboxylesterase
MTSSTVTPADRVFLAEANLSERTPVLFIHGLWLHGTSWMRWLDLFGGYGFMAYAPSWPGDGMTAFDTREHPELIAQQSIDEVMGRYRELISLLRARPIAVGHCFGGLIAQKLLGEGIVDAAIAVDPTPMRGVPHVSEPTHNWRARVNARLNLHRGVKLLTPESFASEFGNKLSRDESDRLYKKYAIPASRQLLVQTGIANFPYGSLTTVQTHTHRGPLLIVGGSESMLVPLATSRSIFEQYEYAPGITEFREFSDRGHTLVVDNGWSEIADYALGWLAFMGRTP